MKRLIKYLGSLAFPIIYLVGFILNVPSFQNMFVRFIISIKLYVLDSNSAYEGTSNKYVQ